MSNPPHNIADYTLFLRGLWNRAWLKLLHPKQFHDGGLRQLYRLPRIRFANGEVRLGAGSILRGRLTIVFGGAARGRLVTGAHFVVDGDAVVSPRGGTIQIGDNCFVGEHCVLQAYDGSSIDVGHNVMIAHGVSVVASNHGMDVELPMAKQPEIAQSIRIEDDVWIGAHAVILAGAVLGKGSVVAAGAVVRGIVEPYSIVGGVPARVLAKRCAKN